MSTNVLKNRHLIGGEWVSTEEKFPNAPVSGDCDYFADGNAEITDQAVLSAEQAFYSFANSTRKQRADLLRSIANELDARGSDITAMGCKETGLPEARLAGERGRTTAQLKLFANHIESGEYLDRRHDPARPERMPTPRSDLRMLQRPIGPVAIFGASNFPLAFSAAGGDTAAALAAGCPVVSKSHPAHPGVSDIVAQCISKAIQSNSMHPGIFNLLQDSGFTVGQALVQHPLIKAVGFTGSQSGGRALFNLCAARPEPIPFFGELGSVNPIFVLPAAQSNRNESIAKDWTASLTLGVGQFCTNPGVIVLSDNDNSRQFVEYASTSLDDVGSQTMLSDAIASTYHTSVDKFTAAEGVTTVLAKNEKQRNASPTLLTCTGTDWLQDNALSEEVFGPLGIIVLANDFDEMVQIANSLQGQLTCTLHIDEEDMVRARELMPILERKAGRVLANGFPTGVEVSNAMVHGGPYPASTNFGATSVGTLSIRRFLRPVCYQDIPEPLLPRDITGYPITPML